MRDSKYLPVFALIFGLFYCQAKPQIEEIFTLKDLTPPQVVSIIPENGATEVHDRPTILIVFNESMDAGSLNSATVTVKTINGTPATGSYEYDETSKSLSIRIVQSLYLNTQYTITVTDKVKDRAGNAITPVMSNFTTDKCPKTRKDRPVFNNAVRTIAKVGCTLYVGGTFTEVGPASSYGVALHKDTGGFAEGYTYEDINGKVEVVTPDGEGGWYIGGHFTRVGGRARNHVAHLAASGELIGWSPNTNGIVYDILVFGDTVYIAGSFSTVAGQPRSSVAAISKDGTLRSWQPAVSGTVNNVYALEYMTIGGVDAIVLGGYFSAVDEQSRQNLAAVSISEGCLNNYHSGCVLAWNPGADYIVKTLAAQGSILYLGGGFGTVGGYSRNRLAAVNASGTVESWNPNANGDVEAIAVSDSTIYVGGSFTCLGSSCTPGTRNHLAAIHTDGTLLSWNPNANNTVHGIAILGDTLYFGGYFNSVGGNPRNLLAAASISPSCLSSYTSAGCLSAWAPNANIGVSAIAAQGNTVYAGGSFTRINPVVRNRLAAVGTDGVLQYWNPSASNPVNSITALGNILYIGGDFNMMNSITRNYVAAVSVDGTLQAWDPNANGIVKVLAASGSSVYAGGNFTTIGGQSRNRLAELNTTNGNATTWNPNADYFVNAIVISGSTIYVGGDFNCFGNCPGGTEGVNKWTRSRLAAITSSGSVQSWNPNADGIVNTLVVSGTTVYAGGNFINMNSIPRKYLAAIDTNGSLLPWHPNANGSVNAIAISGSMVYAGGDFTDISGIARDRLAALSDNANCLNNYSAQCLLGWEPAANNSVNAVLAVGSTIYVGGDFTNIDENPHIRLSSINSDGTVNW